MLEATKQEILFNALMKLNDKFCETMNWSPDSTDDEKTLVKCNLNGFCGFLSRALPTYAADGELISDSTTKG